MKVHVVFETRSGKDAEAEVRRREALDRSVFVQHFDGLRLWRVFERTYDKVFESLDWREAEGLACARTYDGEDVTLESGDGVDVKLHQGRWYPVKEEELPVELAWRPEASAIGPKGEALERGGGKPRSPQGGVYGEDAAPQVPR